MFSPIPTQGNGLAVVVDAEGLDDSQLQAFAAWTNLAETTFLLPPEDPAADYRVRIFTPYQELPFAGHPTLGKLRRLAPLGGCPQGSRRDPPGMRHRDRRHRQHGGALAFVAPPTSVSPLAPDRFDAIAEALGIPLEGSCRRPRSTTGPCGRCSISGRPRRCSRSTRRGRAGRRSSSWVCSEPMPGSECDYEVRMLASNGMEDPITGSLNAALAFWLRDQGRLDEPDRGIPGHRHWDVMAASTSGPPVTTS